MSTQRRPGWYVGEVATENADGTKSFRIATAAESRPEPSLQGWYTSDYWYRAHYFEGRRLPVCGKASREVSELDPVEYAEGGTSTVGIDQCGHCRRVLRATGPA